MHQPEHTLIPTLNRRGRGTVKVFAYGSTTASWRRLPNWPRSSPPGTTWQVPGSYAHSAPRAHTRAAPASSSRTSPAAPAPTRATRSALSPTGRPPCRRPSRRSPRPCSPTAWPSSTPRCRRPVRPGPRRHPRRPHRGGDRPHGSTPRRDRTPPAHAPVLHRPPRGPRPGPRTRPVAGRHALGTIPQRRLPTPPDRSRRPFRPAVPSRRTHLPRLHSPHRHSHWFSGCCTATSRPRQPTCRSPDTGEPVLGAFLMCEACMKRLRPPPALRGGRRPLVHAQVEGLEGTGIDVGRALGARSIEHPAHARQCGRWVPMVTYRAPQGPTPVPPGAPVACAMTFTVCCAGPADCVSA